jgi:hypothetical protein
MLMLLLSSSQRQWGKGKAVEEEREGELDHGTIIQVSTKNKDKIGMKRALIGLATLHV